MNAPLTRLVAAALVVAALSTSCKKEPDTAAIHRNKGYALANEEKWPEALAEYELSLAADPKQEKLWEQKAFALLKTGKKDEAAQALLKTLEFKQEPKDKIAVYRNVAGMYLQAHAPVKAEQYFQEALKLDPNDVESMVWLGEISSQLGGARAMEAPAIPEHLDKALSYYAKATELNADNPTPLLNSRIALIKYIDYHRKQKEAADAEAAANAKDKVKLADAQARSADAQAKIDALKQRVELITPKLTEAMKKVKK